MASGEGQPSHSVSCVAPPSLPWPLSDHSSQLVQALRKALEPALSDISVDWFVPDAVEALLTPREIPALYPGDQLLGYCSLFKVDGFRTRPPGVGLGWGLGGGPGVTETPEVLPNPSSIFCAKLSYYPLLSSETTLGHPGCLQPAPS